MSGLLLVIAALGLGGKFLSGTRIGGDGAEYLMMTHALGTHGSPVLRRDDFRTFLDAPRQELDAMGYPKDFYEHLLRVFETPQPGSYAGYASTTPEQIHSIHFWTYSLLAVPFFWILKLAGANPVAAFTLVNLCCVAATSFYLWRYWHRAWGVATLVFVLSGTTFYLRFTGPEVMTACCLLVATLGAIRNQTALAIFLAGLAATQNPSLALLIPVAILARWATCPAGERRRCLSLASAATRSDLRLSVAGVALAMAPYAYFQAVLGVPSIPGKYFTNPEFISASRFLSLLFDLDQGMLVAVPGLLLAALAVMLQLRHRGLLRASAIAVAIFLLCGVPTLAAINWNSGGVVFARYAYWLAAPFAAVLVYAIHERVDRRRPALLLLIGIQLCMLWHYKLIGKDSAATSHSAAAAWVLDHFPGHYHPDPEIFIERGLGAELPAPLALDRTHLHLVKGHPAKLLVSEQAVGAPVFCPPGQLLAGSKRVVVARSWEYQHAPFQCLGSEQIAARRTELSFGTSGNGNAMLGAGWSGIEGSGAWTDGAAARIQVRPAGKAAVHSLRFAGYYAGATRRTEVEVDGRTIGAFNLANQLVRLPRPPDPDRAWTIVLRHPDVQSPASRGESPDKRRLGFFLERLTLYKTPAR